MRVLHFVPLFWPNLGGIETLLMNSLPILKQNGYEFIILTSTNRHSPDPIDNYKGIPIYRYPIISTIRNHNIGMQIRILRNMIKLKQEFKPDLVHFHFGGYPLSYFHLRTKNAYKAPTLVTLHASIIGIPTAENTTTGELLNGAAWVTAVSDSMAEDAIKTRPDLKRKLSRIYNGVTAPQFTPSPPASPARLLAYGRMVREKGFDLLIDAFGEIIKHHPETRLTLAGDGPARCDLERLTAHHGLKKEIEFTGWIEHNKIFELVDKSTAVIIPSRWREPFGLVAVEAALMKRPVVAAKTAGLAEVVKDEITGLLFDNNNSKELARAILRLLSDPNLTIRLGQNGCEFAQRNFSMKNFIENYDHLYQNIVNRKAHEKTSH